jgi:DNA-directed RNA polymerase specialized sigma24 family protein
MTSSRSDPPQEQANSAQESVESDDGTDPTGERDRLAPRYRKALALEAAGADPTEIADAVDVPLESISSFLHLAHAKQSADEAK